MSRHVLALDQGTTSSRAIVFDGEGAVVAVAQKEFAQHYPRPGWVEHDPLDIWSSQVGVAAEALSRAGLQARDLAAVGIANQRETTLLWDRETLQPVGNAIVWQDRRTAAEVERLREAGAEPTVTRLTGLLLDPYFSASKVAWLLNNVPDARARAEAGELAFGTVDSWLAAKLTGGGAHVTDVSNASRTLLFDIRALDWSDELLETFRVPRAVLPAVVPTSGVVAEVGVGPLAGVPLAALAGDQQAATFGQACFAPGKAKNTYGTGCFLVLNTGLEPRESRHRLLATVAWQTAADADRAAPGGGERRSGPPAGPAARREAARPATYALEGSVFTAGAVVQWLRDGLGVIREAAEVERLATSVPDSGGVSFVPALTGLGAPHWDPYVRGAIVGVTRGTTAAHIARAALEGVALQVADVVDAMRQDSGLPFTELRVDGGAANNDLLMQLQADVAGVTVVRPAVTETTALGAAFLAGLAVGVWGSEDEIAALWREEKRFEPRMHESERTVMRERWAAAVERAKGWEGA
ncbi:MAG TPA: glycerol kinase GlpK [Trueperaceae bacterium]|nr:glycerol kinase GlpK [Trueperaceae bacterium]